MIRSVVIVAALATAASAPAAGAEGQPPGYLNGPELMKLVEESEVVYKIASLEDLEDVDRGDLAGAFWDLGAEEIAWPDVRIEKDGTRTPVSYQFGAECVELLEEAEPLYEAKDYGGAEKAYRKAARKKDCFLAIPHIGDTFYFRGDYKKALKWYEKGLRQNPHYSGTWYFKGNALARLGRPAEARQAYMQALVLRPHKEVVIKTLRGAGEDLDIEIVDEPFQPRAFARQEGEEVGVYFDVESPYWLVYGLCKAVWIGEPDHRRERTGSEERNWTLREERECLGSLVDNYLGLREQGEIEKDALMEKLVAVAKAGAVNGFVLYEIAYRVHPDLALTLDEDVLDQVRAYIDKFVLTPRRRGPWRPGSPW